MTPLQVIFSRRGLRWASTALSLVAIGCGLCMAMSQHDLPSLVSLDQFLFANPTPTPEILGALPRPHMRTDIDLVFGLVLGGFAILFHQWSISTFARRVALFSLLAVGITIGADFATYGLLDESLDHPGAPLWFTSAAAAATIKWCGGLLALGGIPASVGIAVQSLAGWIRIGLRWCRIRLKKLCDFRETKAANAAAASHVAAKQSVAAGVWMPVTRWWRTQPKPVADLEHARWWIDVTAGPDLPRNRKAICPPSAEVEDPKPQPTDAGGTDDCRSDWSWVKAYNVPGAQDVVDERRGEVQAICLSGGGVRSACVAMGAMQVFSGEATAFARSSETPESDTTKLPLIETVDYLISVSGGGYAAGARLLAIQPQLQEREQRRAPADERPPQTQKDCGPPTLSKRFQKGSPEFDFFRRNSSYLADSPEELIRALIVVFKNLVGSLLMLFTVPAMLGWIFGYLLALPYFSIAAFKPVEIPEKKPDGTLTCQHPMPSLVSHSASWLAVAAIASLVLLFLLFAVLIECSPFTRLSPPVWELCIRLARASTIFGLLVLSLLAGLPALMRLCTTIAADNAGAKAAGLATSIVGLNYLTTIAAIAWRQRFTGPVAGVADLSRWKRLLPARVLQLTLTLATFAALLLVWLTTLGAVAAGTFRQETLERCGGGKHDVPIWVWVVGFFAAVVVLGLADVTSLSLHPFYRRRLAHAFAVRRIRPGFDGDASRAERYPEKEWTWLPMYGAVPTKGPKFIFAAAATLDGDANPAPGLNAVSYVLSHDFIGGPALGWLKTGPLFDAVPARLKRDLTVQAAMAVSGAAFASAMGRQDKGFEKLLAVSGARLGTWLPNPKFVHKLATAREKQSVDRGNKDIERPWPNLLPVIRGAGYFYRELFGINYDDARLVQVTDGGHYENLGLVEALRRRSKLIICIDGGGDTPPLLSSLSEAMRLAKYELGVYITLESEGPYSAGKVSPGSGTPLPPGHALASLNSRITKGTVVVGKIIYPPAACFSEDHGVLIFAKAVLYEHLPEWLLTYAASNKVFPHDPTSDQWFNEAQFAAYTTLGRIIGKHVVECLKDLQQEHHRDNADKG